MGEGGGGGGGLRDLPVTYKKILITFKNVLMNLSGRIYFKFSNDKDLFKATINTRLVPAGVILVSLLSDPQRVN